MSVMSFQPLWVKRSRLPPSCGVMVQLSVVPIHSGLSPRRVPDRLPVGIEPFDRHPERHAALVEAEFGLAASLMVGDGVCSPP